MKLICIKSHSPYLKVGQIYEGQKLYRFEPVYFIELNPYSMYGRSDEFITIKEYRKLKLKKINDK